MTDQKKTVGVGHVIVDDSAALNEQWKMDELQQECSELKPDWWDSGDDAPESYDEILSDLEDRDLSEWYGESYETAYAAGDQELAKLIRLEAAATARVTEHARAMQAARKTVERVCNDPARLTEEDFARLEAMQRPGVMIQADTASDPRGLAAWLPSNSDPYEDICKAVGKLKNFNDYVKELYNDGDLTAAVAPTKPVSERTCSNRTCGHKTDVGKPCWNCGNA